MKKIFFLGFAILVAGIANAQSERKSSSLKTEPTGDPLVNGIPYSQYKAQVQAKEQAAKNKTVQQPQVPEQFRIDQNKKWSDGSTAPAPKTAQPTEAVKPKGQ